MSSLPSAGAAVSSNYLLDSSVLVLSLRGDAAIAAQIASAPQVYVSSIVLGELYYGAFGSPTRPDAALADVDTVERTIATLAPYAATACIYARIKDELKRRGLRMPDNDLWIAATAIQYDLTLAARDAHFNWIPALRVEQW